MTKIRLPIITFVLGLVIGATLLAKAVERPLDRAGVNGIGGVFFKAADPEKLGQWYARHLGIDTGRPGVNFFWRRQEDPGQFGLTVWSLFPRDTEYFGPGGQDFMINYRVGDLDALLERLQEQGIPQVGETEDYWYGRFAWIEDGEGNRVELWEPVSLPPEEFERRSQEE